MPGKQLHLIAGISAGITAAEFQLRDRSDQERLCGRIDGGCGGALGALIPDLIDRPFHPNHRSIGHSVLGTLIICGCAWMILSLLVDEWQLSAEIAEENGHAWLKYFYYFLAGFSWGVIAGQVSHLALDAFTPKGLPFVA